MDRILFSSARGDWNTPQWLCVRVRAFFPGGFLDPAAPADDPFYTGCARAYTAAEDGLRQTWDMPVYLNPPYGRAAGRWIDKLIAEYVAGRTPEALALLPARTDTGWWHRLAAAADPLVVFLRGRLKFGRAARSAPFPSVLVYLGRDPARQSELAALFTDAGRPYAERKFGIDNV